ncbi:MAG: CRISPR-associated helicase Cas3' [Blastocatellia bacterium]
MRPALWPDSLDTLLAKGAYKQKPGASSSAQVERRGEEDLPTHTWNVLSRLAELARLRPDPLAPAGEVSKNTENARTLWHCLFWTCFLHDFGKATRGFQAMLKGEVAHYPHRHEVVSLAFLDWIAPALSETEQCWIVAGIVSHHQDANEIALRYREKTDPHPLVAMLAELDDDGIRALWRWLATCSADWIESLGFSLYGVRPLALVDEEQAVRLIREEGVERTKYWLRRYRELIRALTLEEERTVATLVQLRGLTTTADHMASAHVRHVPPGIPDSWEELAQRCLKQDPWIHQRTCAAQASGSAMLAAPTGSGKTEAALFWALGDGACPAPRIFYALPYQASMNAMHQRLSGPKYFKRHGVGLQHGRAVQALYQRLATEGERGAKSAIQETLWRKSLARLHAYPIKVFSPYQMLKTVYALKGFEGMLADYTRAAFIFDEIHAYDPERLAMILCLIKYLRVHYGARFLLMSATFPRLLSDILVDVLGVREIITAGDDVFEDFRRHRLELLDGDLLTDGIDQVVATIARGQSALVCCNTVRRAQAMWEALCERLGNERVELIHSRLTAGHRLAQEQAIDRRCGVDAPHQMLAVVSTQVIEVSLNIDLDTIYSDPATLDALLQRFGRVNRGRNKGIVPVHVYREPRGGQFVYKAPNVERTLAVLEQYSGQVIDETETGRWLDQLYEDPRVSVPWREEFWRQYDLVEQLLLDLRPFESSDERAEQFEALFDGIEVIPERFAEQYANLIAQDRFLEASSLFVSISQKKFAQLRKRQKVRELRVDGRRQWIVQQEYDNSLGLIFDTSLDDVPDHD